MGLGLGLEVARVAKFKEALSPRFKQVYKCMNLTVRASLNFVLWSQYCYLVDPLFPGFFFYFTILYWFCHTSTCIRHKCTCVPHPEPRSHLPHHTIPLGHPSAPAPASCILHRTWTGDSFLIWYYTCFNAILQIIPSSLSHRVQKTVLYICVSFVVSHTGLSLPSF